MGQPSRGQSGHIGGIARPGLTFVGYMRSLDSGEYVLIPRCSGRLGKLLLFGSKSFGAGCVCDHAAPYGAPTTHESGQDLGDDGMSDAPIWRLGFPGFHSSHVV